MDTQARIILPVDNPNLKQVPIHQDKTFSLSRERPTMETRQEALSRSNLYQPTNSPNNPQSHANTQNLHLSSTSITRKHSYHPSLSKPPSRPKTSHSTTTKRTTSTNPYIQYKTSIPVVRRKPPNFAQITKRTVPTILPRSFIISKATTLGISKTQILHCSVVYHPYHEETLNPFHSIPFAPQRKNKSSRAKKATKPNLPQMNERAGHDRPFHIHPFINPHTLLVQKSKATTLKIQKPQIPHSSTTPSPSHHERKTHIIFPVQSIRAWLLFSSLKTALSQVSINRAWLSFLFSNLMIYQFSSEFGRSECCQGRTRRFWFLAPWDSPVPNRIPGRVVGMTTEGTRLGKLWNVEDSLIC